MSRAEILVGFTDSPTAPAARVAVPRATPVARATAAAQTHPSEVIA